MRCDIWHFASLIFTKIPNNTTFTTAVFEELGLKNAILKAKEKYLYISLSVTDQHDTALLYLTLKLLLVQNQYSTLLFVKYTPEFHLPGFNTKRNTNYLFCRNIFLQTISCLLGVKFCHGRSATYVVEAKLLL